MSKENTFRALANKPLIADRWRCRFGWHRWSQWSDPKRDQVIPGWNQSKFCVDCNRFKLIKLKEEYE